MHCRKIIEIFTIADYIISWLNKRIISASLKTWAWFQLGQTHIFDTAHRAPLRKCLEMATAADISDVQLCLYEKSYPIVGVTLFTPNHLEKIKKNIPNIIFIFTFCICDPNGPIYRVQYIQQVTVFQINFFKVSKSIRVTPVDAIEWNIDSRSWAVDYRLWVFDYRL